MYGKSILVFNVTNPLPYPRNIITWGLHTTASVHLLVRLGIQPLFGDEPIFRGGGGGERGLISEQRLDTEPIYLYDPQMFHQDLENSQLRKKIVAFYVTYQKLHLRRNIKTLDNDRDHQIKWGRETSNLAGDIFFPSQICDCHFNKSTHRKGLETWSTHSRRREQMDAISRCAKCEYEKRGVVFL